VAKALNGKIEIIKLWENASPTSEFQNQSIPIGDFSDYDFIGIVTGYNTAPANGTQLTISQIRHQGTTTIACHCVYVTSGNSKVMPYRKAEILATDKTTVVFGNGYDGEEVLNNHYAIPHTIYGIKGV